MKKAPRNTSYDTYRLALLGGDSNDVLKQTVQGQDSFVNSTTLPTDIMTQNGKEILEGFGVVWDDVVEDDPLFQHVTLPEGWTREGTGHSMHSDVLDEKGRKRIGIFYKAAFYDRSAHMSLTKRYSYRHDYDRQDRDNVGVTQIKDGDNVIHTTEPIVIKEDDKGFRISERCNKLAIVWLDEHYPDWNNPAAYWD